MTIPVMKKTGFRASYAAAIEACASTGAVLAPPVMGATAFVMAQFMNVSYAEVALAATIPSVLYYVGLFMQVDSYAARHELKGIPRAELPRLSDAIKEGWYYLFVIVMLVVMLLHFKRESHAPFYASCCLSFCISGPDRHAGDLATLRPDRIRRRDRGDAVVDIPHAVLWGMTALVVLNEAFRARIGGGGAGSSSSRSTARRSSS